MRDGRLVHIRRIVQTELPSHYGVFSTVRDLVKWELAFTAGKVLKRTSLEQIWTAVKLADGSTRPYGFGWVVDEVRGHRLISHDGITGTEYSRFPDDALTVIVLTNLGANVGATGVNSCGITLGVADRYIPELLVSSITPQPDPDPQRLVALRGFLREVARGQDGPLMNSGLNAAMEANARISLSSRLRFLKKFRGVPEVHLALRLTDCEPDTASPIETEFQ